ncbi:hypothetical protein [Treponema phagedenis]|uniref:hypothetical protein n=1 Tax=Treponema phagedenis TaxID=162 RepID=UPI0015A39D17|nr:hypothetical protein [Treponema phagedenis]QLC59856.1 hypothetical protein HW453_14390 [Treponema phagedenis]
MAAQQRSFCCAAGFGKRRFQADGFVFAYGMSTRRCEIPNDVLKHQHKTVKLKILNS